MLPRAAESTAGATAEGAGTSAQCFFSADVTLTPGLSMTPSAGKFTTNGETGRSACYGVARGQQIEGLGPIGFEGDYGVAGGDTCAGGVATGVGVLTVPTRGGPVRITAPFAVNYVSTGLGYFTAVAEDGTNFSGTIEFAPLAGDCLTAPLTAFRLVSQATLTGP